MLVQRVAVHPATRHCPATTLPIGLTAKALGLPYRQRRQLGHRKVKQQHIVITAAEAFQVRRLCFRHAPRAAEQGRFIASNMQRHTAGQKPDALIGQSGHRDNELPAACNAASSRPRSPLTPGPPESAPPRFTRHDAGPVAQQRTVSKCTTARPAAPSPSGHRHTPGRTGGAPWRPPLYRPSTCPNYVTPKYFSGPRVYPHRPDRLRLIPEQGLSQPSAEAGGARLHLQAGRVRARETQGSRSPWRPRSTGPPRRGWARDNQIGREVMSGK